MRRYVLYISNDCAQCDDVVDYIKRKRIECLIINVDDEGDGDGDRDDEVVNYDPRHHIPRTDLERSAMAAANHLPVAPHDCVGPITLINGIHLSLSAPNAMIQETVRAFNNTWYRDIIETMPKIENGYVYPMKGYGIGTKFKDEFLSDKETIINSTE